MERKPSVRPKRDFLVLAAVLPALVAAGFIVSLCAVKTGILPGEKIKAPAVISGWIAVITLSLSTGCLEEVFFRVYLPERLMEIKPVQTRRSTITAFVVSGLIFALCHAYEGLWGVINALLAALILSIAYIKSSSLPGIALAHGLYNIFVFMSAALEL